MASKKTDVKTETQDSFDVNDELKSLSCPFSWNMKNILLNEKDTLSQSGHNNLDKMVDMQDIFPELVLIYHLMLAYEKVMYNEPISAMNYIDWVEENLANVKKMGTLRDVENVLQHIFVATKCHVLKKLSGLVEIDDLLKGICNIEDIRKNKTESAMLYGCQCLAWTLYHVSDNSKAKHCAEKAIECEPTNGKWHFLLAKIYRRDRRSSQILSRIPSEIEISSQLRAFQLSRNVLFGVELARLYRESHNYKKADQIYKEIYDLQPTSSVVQLQLALGFIRLNESKLAKCCLDNVQKKIPKSTIYNHYMGIYEEKCNKDLNAALLYYSRAVDDLNYAAEWQYMKCKKNVHSDWDPLPYLLGMVKKYETYPDYNMQVINIQIGMYYLFEQDDILSACLWFTKAINIQPNATILKNCDFLLGRRFKINVYKVLKENIDSALMNTARKYDNDTIHMLRKTLILCQLNCTDSPPISVSSNQLRLSRSQMSSHSSSQGQCGSTHFMVNSRNKKPSSSDQPLRGKQSQKDRDVKNITRKRSVKHNAAGTSNPDLTGYDEARTAAVGCSLEKMKDLKL